MKVLYFEDVIRYITLIPRVDFAQTDILLVNLRDELTKVSSDINHTFTFGRGYATIGLEDSVVPNFFKLDSKYELLITLNGVVVYKGKAIMISNTKSVQDYRLASVTNDKITY